MQQRAIVLGGTRPHIDLIENLHKRGYYVILLDYLENPIAKEYADQHEKISTLDKDAVLTFAKKENSTLVIAACIDQANAVACYVSERLGLPHPYSYEIARNVTEKDRMKKVMSENNIPTSNFIVMDSHSRVDQIDLKFPVVVKPVDANSSKGVKKASNFSQLKEYIPEALSYSRKQRNIVEEFSEGKEIQIDCLVHDGSTEVIMTREKRKTNMEVGVELQSIGSRIPAELSDIMIDKIEDIARKIAESFGLNNTPFFIQAVVKNDDINVLEFAPRVGGGLSYSILKKIRGFDAVDSVVRSYLGEEIAPVLKPNKEDITYLTYLLYGFPGTYSHFEGVDELLGEKIIDEFYLTKKSGSKISSEMSSGNRIGSLLISGNNEDELKYKNERIRECLRAFDVHGRPMLRRDLISI